MFKILIIGFAIVAINVCLQAVATTYWVRNIRKSLNKKGKPLTSIRIFTFLIVSFLGLTLLHMLHSFIWALAIQLIPATQSDFSSFNDIFYYSIITFTTLGYGDITISSSWKLLSGVEAINGIMLIGWSTALMYSLIQNVFKTLNSRSNKTIEVGDEVTQKHRM